MSSGGEVSIQSPIELIHVAVPSADHKFIIVFCKCRESLLPGYIYAIDGGSLTCGKITTVMLLLLVLNDSA